MSRRRAAALKKALLGRQKRPAILAGMGQRVARLGQRTVSHPARTIYINPTVFKNSAHRGSSWRERVNG
jgi:hypothetical protein